MALANISYTGSILTAVPNVSFNPGIVEIFNQDNKSVDINDIYVSITEPPLNITVNVTRDNSEWPQWKQTLNFYFSSSMGIGLVILMLGMGCHVSWREVLNNLWPPLPMIIGMCGQFVVLPALAFGISKLFKMEPYTALGTLILSSSPGGALSNIFTYWIKGDVALSLVMTTCSTMLSFGAMPLNIWIYSSYIVGPEAENIVIPYKNIVTTLAYVCGPVVAGILIRHFSDRIANKITQIANIIGAIIVAFNIVCILILFGDTMASAKFPIHVSVMILAPTGMFLAYIIAYFSGRSHKVCRTIAVETASQNMPVALGIIVLSFPDITISSQMMVYPLLYIMYGFSEITLAAVIIRLHYYRIETYKVQSEMQLRIKERNSADN